MTTSSLPSIVPWACIRLIALTLAVSVGSAPAAAQVDVWTPLGPDAPGEALVVLAPPQQPGVVYAGMSGGGLFMSEDHGNTWRSMANGLASSWIGDLLMTPEGSLYAATDRGVFRWQPQAESWRRISEGLPERQYLSRLAVDPTDPDTLYTTATYGYTGSWELYRTRDGEHWAHVPSPSYYRSVAIAPTSPPTLLAGSPYSGFLRSRSGGLSWQSSTVGLPEHPTFSDILVDPASPTTIYASVEDFPDRAALPYKSLDGGATWTLAAEGITNGYIHDGGRLAVDPAPPHDLLWGSSRGIFRSSDGAASWQPANSAPANRRIHDLAFAPNGFLFAGIDHDVSGVLRSADGGRSWEVLAEGLTASLVRGLSPDPEIPGRLIAATAETGLQVSDDGGNVWRPVAGGPLGSVTSLVRDLETPSTLYATAGKSLYRSLDSGSNWQRIGPQYPEFFDDPLEPVVQDPSVPATLYVASGGEIWRSLDGGDQWLPFASAPCRRVLTLAPPAGDGVLLGGCYQPSTSPVSPPVWESFLLRSLDGGVSWEEIRLPGYGSGTWSFTRGLSPGTLLASLGTRFAGGAFRSGNSGATWTPIAGLQRIGVMAMLADPESGDIFAATSGQGVLRSADDGATWLPFNEGLASGWVEALVHDPRVPGRLWAGTAAGAHRLDRFPKVLRPCCSRTPF